MKIENKHNDWLFEQLKDAEFAADFLNAASEDSNSHYGKSIKSIDYKHVLLYLNLWCALRAL